MTEQNTVLEFMWKKIVSAVLALLVIGLLGFYLSERVKITNEPSESIIDSLETLRVSYESMVDSFFSLRKELDSLTEIKIQEVAEYKFNANVEYLQKETGIKKISIGVTENDDSVALLENTELSIINTRLAELAGLRERVVIDDTIIETLSKNLDVADTLLVLKDRQIEAEKQKTKKAKRKYFGIGGVTGIIIGSAIWILL